MPDPQVNRGEGRAEGDAADTCWWIARVEEIAKELEDRAEYARRTARRLEEDEGRDIRDHMVQGSLGEATAFNAAARYVRAEGREHEGESAEKQRDEAQARATQAEAALEELTTTVEARLSDS